MTGYYDLVLGLIPLALGGIAAVLTVLGVSLTTAVPIASLVSVGLIGHAMFVRAPVDQRPATQRGPAAQAGPAADEAGFQSAD